MSHAELHSLEAEQTVLGAIMLADQWLDSLVVDIGLVPDDFYRERHRVIFGGMLRLRSSGEPIDTLTVAEHVRAAGDIEEAGGADYIETLVERIPAIANTKKYAQIIKDNSLLRQTWKATQDIQEAIAAGGQPRDLIDMAQREILAVNYETKSSKPVKIDDALAERMEQVEQLATEGREITGTPSGFAEIDDLTAGFQPSNLIVLAARPSMGKSALGAQWCYNAAAVGKPAVLVTLEMSRGEVVDRLLAFTTGVENSDIRRGRLTEKDWGKLLVESQAMENLPLWIDDAPGGLNVLTLRSKLRRLDTQARSKYKQGLGLVIVDYLQQLRPLDPGMNRVQQVAEMSHGLKSIARELNVPVVALSQLSRAVESRKPPRPVLSDLRDSGDIEQDADLVGFLYREEYYKPDTEKQGVAEFIVAKHRNGPVGELELGFIATVPKFVNDPLADIATPAEADFVLDRL